jgi:hypothetical protein
VLAAAAVLGTLGYFREALDIEERHPPRYERSEGRLAIAARKAVKFVGDNPESVGGVALLLIVTAQGVTGTVRSRRRRARVGKELDARVDRFMNSSAIPADVASPVLPGSARAGEAATSTAGPAVKAVTDRRATPAPP